MARQARIEYSGALHHVRSRGNRGEAIFLDDRDRLHFLALLEEAVHRYRWIIMAWVFMTNHFHVAIQTPETNLSDGMRWLLGSYVAWFNRRHGITGHLMGDRFHSDLVESERYLTELVRYLVLNPVRARMVEHPSHYRWSSYRATAGLETAPDWLALDVLAPHLGSSESWPDNYRDYVAERIGSDERLWDQLTNGIYLGSEEWIESLRKRVESKTLSDVHPRRHRHVGRPKMAAIIKAVAGAFGVTEQQVRRGHGGPARRMAAWIGWYEGLARLRSIAAALRIASSGRASDLVAECERMLYRNGPMQQKADLALAALQIA
ncbi:MAG: transposase [Acidobacteriota bacterium]